MNTYANPQDAQYAVPYSNIPLRDITIQDIIDDIAYCELHLSTYPHKVPNQHNTGYIPTENMNANERPAFHEWNDRVMRLRNHLRNIQRSVSP